MEDEELPIYHMHFKVLSKQQKDGDWFALFIEPNGETTWMQQPIEPVIGDEQIVYVIRNGTLEGVLFGQFVEKTHDPEKIEKFLQDTAKKYGVWCEKSWEQVYQELKQGQTIH